MLITAVPGGRLDRAAALDYMRARAAGLPPGITSSYRSWDHQLSLYNKWVRRVPGYNFALHPSKSNHVKGTALDLPGNVNDTSTPRGWMRKYGRAYGFHPISNEEWHFDHYPTQKDEDMAEPNDRYGNRDLDQPLVKGKWNSVRVTDNGGTSVAFGADKALSTVTVAVQAPAGTQLRGRFYKYDQANRERGYTYDRESKFDTSVTKGNTLCFTTTFLAKLRPSERLRFELFTWDDGVKITSAAYRTLEW